LALWQKEYGSSEERVRRAFADHPVYGSGVVTNRVNIVGISAKSDELDQDDERGAKKSQDEYEDDLPTVALFLKPGDVVEIAKPDREPVIAVFVRQVEDISQFYSANGRVTDARLNTISFVISGCINPALVTPLAQYFPTTLDDASVKDLVEIPRDLSAPVQQLLLDLGREAEATYRDNSAVLDNAYVTLADQSKLRMMTLEQIAKTLLAPNDPTWQPSHSVLLAVRKALHHNTYQFRPDVRNSRLTNVFGIRPKDDIEVTETVLEWVRQYREAMAAAANESTVFHSHWPQGRSGVSVISRFVDKARRLVAQSRTYRDHSHRYQGPDKHRLLDKPKEGNLQAELNEIFNNAERQIIAFLKYWALSKQFVHMSTLHAAGCTILRAVGLYDDLPATDGPSRAGEDVGLLFLQEIGVITPYENPAVYDEHLMLPIVHTSRNMDVLRTKAELTRNNPDFRDAMEGLRKDMGTMEVYCIDDPGAKEIDDGVSISRVPGSDSEFWVHTHVANPTAFFEKSHVLSGLAAHMTQTVYMPERAFPMLPEWVTQNYFSLTCDRPALTISNRINREGAVLESSIQPTILRRVTAISPDEVDEILGISRPRGAKLIVGGSLTSPSKKTDRVLDQKQVQDLRDLHVAAKRLLAGRVKQGALRGHADRFGAKVYETSERAGLTWRAPSDNRSRLIRGDPIIELSGSAPYDEKSHDMVYTQNIVEEMMILACSTAASWCAQRNIPVMYRGSIETPMSTMAAETFRETIVKPYLQKHGRLSRRIIDGYITALGRAIAHTSPLPHRFLGVESYAKVTSPLRRFSDMVAHWQIEAALRYEAHSGRQFDFDNPPAGPKSMLPFTREQMQESIMTFSVRERIIKQAQNSANLHWACLALVRAHFYGEAKLPETFKVYVRRVEEGPDGAGRIRNVSEGLLLDYGLRVFMPTRLGADIEEGDEWDARIVDIDVYTRSIYMEPVRLLHRDEKLL
jgi:hypothetical protein